MSIDDSNSIAPEIETESHELYRITDKLEIHTLLQELCHRRSHVHVYYNGGQSNLTTEFISIDAVLNTMVLDGYAANTAHSEILDMEHWVAVSLLDYVKVQFKGGRLYNSQNNGQFVLETDVPDSMIRLQRRNFYRVTTEDDMIVSMRIFHPSGKNWEGEVLDLSVGGCAVVIDDSLPIKELSKGPVKCELNLPDMGVFTIQTEIRTVRHIEQNKSHVRLGCKFVNLNQELATKLQRYLINAERAIRTGGVWR
jgi:c-di-GMP-binding flagellar brake protein YcgR